MPSQGIRLQYQGIQVRRTLVDNRELLARETGAWRRNQQDIATLSTVEHGWQKGTRSEGVGQTQVRRREQSGGERHRQQE